MTTLWNSMSLPLAASILLALSYLIGAIPFGYLVGRLRGVNLFAAGSGNIGATNAVRVLGAGYGILVFVLDFLKGVVPCALIVPFCKWIVPESGSIPATLLQVSAAALAFLGHMFPIYLGFRGGKGVATGAGTIFVLVPGPAALAVAFWIATLLASRTVSLASLIAVVVLVAAYVVGTRDPFSEEERPLALYLIAGAAMVFVKHRGNLTRLLQGTESQVRDFRMRQTVLRTVHILALGTWFGGAAFFNFVTAPAIFDSFKQVVYGGPSDRTAQETLLPADASVERKNALASALAGSAVGPVFPRYFAMQAICGGLALVSALSWWNAGGKVHRWRIYLIAAALLTVAIGWPISNQVSEVRLQRFSPDSAAAEAAKAGFAAWHLVSLFLSFVTVILAGVSLALASRLPGDANPVATTNGSGPGLAVHASPRPTAEKNLT